MNSRPRVPAEASSDELVQANAHVAYPCGVNSKSHNPSSRGSNPTGQILSFDMDPVVLASPPKDVSGTNTAS
jgi:hypothetical protein